MVISSRAAPLNSHPACAGLPPGIVWPYPASPYSMCKRVCNRARPLRAGIRVKPASGAHLPLAPGSAGQPLRAIASAQSRPRCPRLRDGRRSNPGSVGSPCPAICSLRLPIRGVPVHLTRHCAAMPGRCKKRAWPPDRNTQRSGRDPPASCARCRILLKSVRMCGLECRVAGHPAVGRARPTPVAQCRHA